MSFGKLADTVGCSGGHISGILSNRRDWEADPGLLSWATKIIKACGGTAEDIERWLVYHNEVVAYQTLADGRDVPTPPEPHQIPGHTTSAVLRQPVDEDTARLLTRNNSSDSTTTTGTGSVRQSGNGQNVANTGTVGGDFTVGGCRS
jgi:hypothetical protein